MIDHHGVHLPLRQSTHSLPTHGGCYTRQFRSCISGDDIDTVRHPPKVPDFGVAIALCSTEQATGRPVPAGFWNDTRERSSSKLNKGYASGSH